MSYQLVFFDGFEGITPTQMLRRYSAFSDNSSSVTTGALLPFGNYLTGGHDTRVRVDRDALLSGKVTGIVGGRFSWPAGSITAREIFVLYDSGGNRITSLSVGTDGKLHVNRGFMSDTSLATSTNVEIAASQSYYLEYEFTISDTVGTTKVWIKGGSHAVSEEVPGLTLTGQDNHFSGASPEVTQAQWWIGTDGGAMDDLTWLMDTGTAQFSAHLGPRRVDMLVPSGAGTTTGFTPSTGSNYACVDDATPNDDTDYVESDVSTTRDLYAMANLPSASVAYDAIVQRTVAKKSDAGAASFQHVNKSGGTTTVASSAHALTTSYAEYEDAPIVVDPNTSAAWTLAGINALESGLEVV